MNDQPKAKKKRQRDEAVSLNPLDPKEALADLLKVKPEKKQHGKRSRQHPAP